MEEPAITSFNNPSYRGAGEAARPVLLVITGYPGSGKTTLSRKLAERFHLPCFNKDDFKERLADVLGCEDSDESKRLGRATYAIMDYVTESVLRAGISFLVESNFSAPLHSERFARMVEQHGYYPLQILCKAEPEVLLERVTRRIQSGERHFAHKEQEEIASGRFRIGIGKGRIEPLVVGGEILELDTTDFTRIDYNALYTHIATVLAPPICPIGT